MFCIIYRESNSHYSCRSQTQSIADKTEYIKQISGLLGSKDFRERIKGIDQLVADCQHNPNMVINSIFPVSAHIFFSKSYQCFFMCFVLALSYTHAVEFHHEKITKMSLFHLLLFFPLGSLFFYRCLMPSRQGCRSPTAKSTCTPLSLYKKSSTR